jgi:tryptophan-rich sensory protein
LFFPAWLVLYISMGYASFRVWDKGNGFKGEARIPLIVFIIQLLLNWMWTPVFFGFKALGAAFAVIICMWITILATIILFYRVDKIAAFILIPYLGWISFASALNYSLWQLN